MLETIKKIVKRLRLRRKLYVAYDSGGHNKPTIVLLHGIAATHRTWGDVIKELDGEFRVVALDMLGFGRSPRPIGCNYTVEEHAMYVHRTLRGMHLRRPFIIVGHSMGSIVAAHYAKRYPWEVRSAYLMSLPLYIRDKKMHTNLSRAHTDIYLNAYKFLISNREFTIKHSQNLRNLLKIEDGIDINEDNWESFRLSLVNTIIKQDVYSDISRLNIPVHVIYGLLDEFLVQESIALLDNFDNITITRLSSVDHSISPRFASKVADMIKKDQ